jgi:hypothetical protein
LPKRGLFLLVRLVKPLAPEALRAVVLQDQSPHLGVLNALRSVQGVVAAHLEGPQDPPPQGIRGYGEGVKPGEDTLQGTVGPQGLSRIVKKGSPDGEGRGLRVVLQEPAGHPHRMGPVPGVHGKVKGALLPLQKGQGEGIVRLLASREKSLKEAPKPLRHLPKPSS